VLHCWEDGPRTADDCGTTCMLEADHDGPHEWTHDDEITLQFTLTSQPKDTDHE
jgi:hypothetical protein